MTTWLIEGADRETGADVTDRIPADSKADAERIAGKRGILVSKMMVDTAKPVVVVREKRDGNAVLWLIAGLIVLVGAAYVGVEKSKRLNDFRAEQMMQAFLSATRDFNNWENYATEDEKSLKYFHFPFSI